MQKCVYMYLPNAKIRRFTDTIDLLNTMYVSAMNPICMQIFPIIIHNIYMSAQTFNHMQQPNDSTTKFPK